MVDKFKDKKVIIAIIILIIVISLIITGTLLKNNQTYNNQTSTNHQSEKEEEVVVDASELEVATEVIIGEEITEPFRVDENTTWTMTEEVKQSLTETAKRFFERDQEMLKPYIEKGLTEEEYIEHWIFFAYDLNIKNEDSFIREMVL